MWKISICLILSTLFNASHTNAQNSTDENVKFFGKTSNLIKYKYNVFAFGKLYMKDGDSSGGKMNLNYLTGKMDFLGAGDEVMSLTDENTIKNIVIGLDTFYYANGFIEQIKQTDKVLLAVKKEIKIVDKEKLGAFGLTTTTGNVESKDAVLENQNIKLKKTDIDLVKENMTYYISNKKNPFVEATRRNIIEIYSGDKNKISKYLATNNVDLKSEKDLLTLIEYMNK